MGGSRVHRSSMTHGASAVQRRMSSSARWATGLGSLTSSHRRRRGIVMHLTVIPCPSEYAPQAVHHNHSPWGFPTGVRAADVAGCPISSESLRTQGTRCAAHTALPAQPAHFSNPQLMSCPLAGARCALRSQVRTQETRGSRCRSRGAY